jgi:hypothetical protein
MLPSCAGREQFYKECTQKPASHSTFRELQLPNSLAKVLKCWAIRDFDGNSRICLGPHAKGGSDE